MRLKTTLAKLAIAGSLSVGLLLMALGIWGDHAGWWNNWSFLTNLLASFTTALIGFPVALLVVNQIAVRYRLDTDQRLVRSRAVRLVQDMNSETVAWCPHPDRIGSLLALFQASYRTPTPEWVVLDSINHWKAAFPIAKLEANPSEYRGVIAETAPNWERGDSLFAELLELRSSYQAAGLEWPDENLLADCRRKLAQMTSTKFRNDFRVAAQELMRLDEDGASTGALSVDDMTRAVEPLNAVLTVFRYLTDFFGTSGPKQFQ